MTFNSCYREGLRKLKIKASELKQGHRDSDIVFNAMSVIYSIIICIIILVVSYVLAYIVM